MKQPPRGFAVRVFRRWAGDTLDIVYSGNEISGEIITVDRIARSAIMVDGIAWSL